MSKVYTALTPKDLVKCLEEILKENPDVATWFGWGDDSIKLYDFLGQEVATVCNENSEG